jgi:hypothetical protein
VTLACAMEDDPQRLASAYIMPVTKQEDENGG